MSATVMYCDPAPWLSAEESLPLKALVFLVFFFNDTATTEIYTLSLHDALPICTCRGWRSTVTVPAGSPPFRPLPPPCRSEEHTSELQSLRHLVCRLLLEKKKKKRSEEQPESLTK